MSSAAVAAYPSEESVIGIVRRYYRDVTLRIHRVERVV